MVSILEYSILGIPLLPVVAVILAGYLIYSFAIRKKGKNLLDKPPDIKIDKEISKNLDKIISLHGYRAGNFKNLRMGLVNIGKIITFSIEYHNKEIIKIENLGEITAPIESKNIYFLVRIRKFGLIGYILSWLGLGINRYIINGMVIENYVFDNFNAEQDLVLNQTAVFRSYQGVFYCDTISRNLIQDLAINMAFEQQTKKLVEFTPLMTLLEIEQAKVKFKSELFTKLEKERFRGDVEKYAK